MRIFSIFILSISMVFIGQDIRTDAADIVTLNLSPSAGKPLFPSSVVSNDIDFIKSTDASVAYCIAFQKTGRAKMVDKRHNRLLTLNVSFFVVRFADGTRVGLWVHPDLGPRAVILHYARHVARGLSHLPSAMRETLSHVVIHHGDETAFAEDEEHFFVLYHKNIDTRLQQHDLEETIFHESVHATLDDRWSRDPAWRFAQAADGAFITHYAKAHPNREDLAETALFSYVLLTTPERFSDSLVAKIRQLVPNRLAFFKRLFLDGQPLLRQIRKTEKC